MTGKNMSRYKQLLAQRAKLDEEIEAARKIATQHAIEHARRVAPAAALADTPFPCARRQATCYTLKADIDVAPGRRSA